MKLSRHAQMRRKQMRVTEARIEAALTEPEVVYPGDARYGPGRHLFLRDDLAVVADADGTVITVLWRGHEEWDREARP